MKKFGIILFYIFILYSCRTNRLNVVGKYVTNKGLNLTKAEIYLDNDHTFKYRFLGGDLYRFTVNGKWAFSADKKKIILNSCIKNDNDIISVYEENSNSWPENRKKIIVEDSSNNPIPIYLRIDPETGGKIKFENSDEFIGSKYFNSELINKIALTSVGSTKIILYKTKHPNYNKFIIRLKISLSQRYKYFDNSILYYRKNKLIEIDSNSIRKVVYFRSRSK